MRRTRSLAPVTSCFVIFLGLLAYLVYSYYRSIRQDKKSLLLLKYSFWLAGAFLLLSPTVHPWYLTWVLPFLCIFPLAGWILLTGKVILARSVYIAYEASGVWQEIWWVRLVEYGPPYLLMLYGAFGNIRDRLKGRPVETDGGKR